VLHRSISRDVFGSFPINVHVTGNIDLSEKDNFTVLQPRLNLELSYGSSFLCVILVGCRSNIICYIIFQQRNDQWDHG